MAVRLVVALLLMLTGWSLPVLATDPTVESLSATQPPEPKPATQADRADPSPAGASPGEATASRNDRDRLSTGDAEAQYRTAVDLLTASIANGELTAPRPSSPGAMLEAIQALRGAVQREPDWIAPRLLLAETLLRTGDLDGAVGEFRRLTQRGQREPRAHLGLAKGLMAKQAWADAHVELRAAIREDPTLAEAHYLLGAVLYSQGRLRGAIEAYRKTLWLKPTFPDAHHQLGVLLKLANRHKEAVIEFRLAAEGGVPDAQFFLGQAYRNGTGVPVDLTQVVHWWIRATEQGHSQAWSSLKQLRRIARAENAAPASKIAADIQQAFTNYRASLWQEVPDLAHSDENDSAGLALLTQGRPEAVPLLIREAWSLSETAQAKLIELYAQGVPGSLPAFDARILRYLEFCATENRPDSKVELAHVYFLGLGVPKDPDRVKTLLKGLSKVERLRLLEEFANEQASK